MRVIMTKRLKSASKSFENTSVPTSISKLYLQGDLADVKFAFKNPTQFLPAHKVILASGSKVFHTMFFGSLPEKGIVNIDDASYSEFTEFLQFFYLPKVNLSEENIECVARLADKYDMLDCLNTCASFLQSQLTNDNMFWGYQLAVSFNIQKLKQFCEDKIKYEPMETLQSTEFLNCNLQVLKGILEMDKIACNEVDIFTMCMAWAKTSCRKKNLNENDSQNLKRQLGDCFYLIRFGAMTSEEIGDIMTNQLYAGMFSRVELLEVLCTTTATNFRSKIFSQKSNRLCDLSFQHIKKELLICHRSSSLDYCVKQQDVFFKSNVSLLLGEIHFTELRIRPIYTIKITENNVLGDLFNGSSQTTLFNRSPRITISKALIIKAEKIYRISISIENCDANGSYQHDPGLYSSSTSTLSEGVIITFLNDPNQTSNNSQCLPKSLSGGVTALHFKRL